MKNLLVSRSDTGAGSPYVIDVYVYYFLTNNELKKLKINKCDLGINLISIC